jgi:glycosyltransferase involved in cell wall biosynthesis
MKQGKPAYYLYMLRKTAATLLYMPRYLRFKRLIRQALANEEWDILFCFPYYHTGGAEQVHADILKALSNYRTVTLITTRSESEALKARFAAHTGQLIDLGFLGNYTIYRKLLAAYIAGLLNKTTGRKVIFGCNAHLFYDVVKDITQANIVKIDLLHAFSRAHERGMELYSLPFADRLDARVVINNVTRQQLADQYEQAGLSSALAGRIRVIPNGAEIPAEHPPKQWNQPWQVIFVGRGGPEKRVHLVAEIARECAEKSLPLRFTSIGDNRFAVPAALQPYLHFEGELTDKARLNAWYQSAHIILVTSYREGFPMVLMEAMGYGVAPICTQVGGIPEYIKNGENGWLVPAEQGEAAIVEQFVSQLATLLKDPGLAAAVAAQAYATARQHFSMEVFTAHYRQLITELK